MSLQIVEVVDSSAILKIGYDGENLLVQYVSGDWYKYFHVPETVFKQFCKADSKGTFINKEIKSHYDFESCLFNPVR